MSSPETSFPEFSRAFIDRYDQVGVPEGIVTSRTLDDTVIPEGDVFLKSIVDSLDLSYRTQTDYISERFEIIRNNRELQELPRFTQEVWFGDIQELGSFKIVRDRERQIVLFAKYALLPETIDVIQGMEIGEAVETQQ